MKIVIGNKKSNGTFDKSQISITSANVGGVQPFFFRTCVPHEKLSLKSYSEVRLAPMIAPTFGVMDLRQYYSAIKVSEIWRPWHHYISQLPYSFISRVSGATTLSKVPVIPKVNPYYLFLDLLTVDYNCDCAYFTDVVFDRNTGLPSSGTFEPLPTTGNVYNYVLNLSDGNLGANYFAMIYANTFSYNYSTGERGQDGFHSLYRDIFCNSPKASSLSSTSTLEDIRAYDILIDSGSSGYFAIKLGEFGKILRKMFIGLNLNVDSAFCWRGSGTDNIFIDFPSSDDGLKSILPIVAYCKTIFDPYGIRRYADYEQSYIGKLVDLISNDGDVSTSSSLEPSGSYLDYRFNFDNSHHKPTNASSIYQHLGMAILECCYNAFFTLDVDYFSSVEKNVGDSLGRSYAFGSITSGSSSTGTAYVTSQQISTSDGTHPILIKMGQKILPYVNQNTAFGASIVKFFKARGIVVDNDLTSRSYMLGRDKVNINIGTVFSTAGTATTNLADYAGNGQGRNKGENINYTASDYSYVFGFMVVVPRVSYYQGEDPEYNRINDRFSFFTPEFDSLGRVPVSSSTLIAGTDGLIGNHPRYFDYKFNVAGDCINGDMSIPSMFNSMSPYYYERRISGGYIQKVIDGSLLTSDIFRKLGLKESLGQYLRIFRDSSPLRDHFYISIGIDCKSYAPMLPTSESWETYDEDDNHKTAVNKS